MLRSMLAFLLISLCVLVGCGEKNSIDAVFVEGIVTIDGVPTDGVNLIFASIKGDGISGGGITDTKGYYTTTSGNGIPGSGLLAGEYNVTFSKSESPGADLSFEEYQAKFGDSRPQPIYIVPQKYDDATKSGIEPITVTKGKKNKFDFDLKTK